MRVLRIIAGSIVCLMSIRILAFGAQFLHGLLKITFSQALYVRGEYLDPPVMLLILGLVAFAFGACAAIRRRPSGGLLLCGFAAAVLGFVALPSAYNPKAETYLDRARSEVRRTADALVDSLFVWGKKNGRLPASEAEFREAVGVTPALSAQSLSRYAQRGIIFPYRAVYRPNETGPYLGHPGPAPAVIYCVIGPELKRFWVTATDLDRAVGGRVSFLPDPRYNELDYRPFTFAGDISNRASTGSEVESSRRNRRP